MLARALAHAEAATSGPRSFSAEGLAKVGDYIRNEIATGKIPGAILLIQQHGKPVYFENFGVRDVATQLPMTADTIFRLYSMSKPITSVAHDDAGRGRQARARRSRREIHSGLCRHEGRRREEGREGKLCSLEPLNRPITIEDLLRHTSGLTYGFYGDSTVRKLYADADLFNGDVDNAEFVERIAKLPLAEQPGTLWDYGHSTDVLGRVIEVISGKSLLQFEKERLLDPLGMSETAFFVADPAKAAAHRRADAERSRHQPGHAGARSAGSRELGIGRRRHGRHHRRLRALLRRCCSTAARSTAGAISSRRRSR